MKTEKILSIVFLISLVFKIADWPGSGPIMVLSLLFLTFCYFPFGFYFLNEKNVFKQKLGTSIIYGWLLATPIIGILFKLMYWPGYGPMLMVGTITTAILLVVAYIMHKKATTEEAKLYHTNLLSRTLILFICSLAFFLISEKSIMNFTFQNNEKLKSIYLKNLENPNEIQFQKEIKEYHKEELKKQIK